MRVLFTVVFLTGLLSGVACKEIDTTYQDCPCYQPKGDLISQYEWDESVQGCKPVVPDVQVEDLVEDTSGASNLVGVACETDPEDPTNLNVPVSVCETGECFTKDTLAFQAGQLGAEWPYDIPNGMCSKFLCFSDAECGDSGFCFNVAPLFEAPIPIGLCLKRCNEYSDCRYPEGYVCYFTGIPGERACLPSEIVVDIPCGNGVCDASELDRGICPRDCCGDGVCDKAEDATKCPEDCP